jgi:hypothetical protein
MSAPMAGARAYCEARFVRGSGIGNRLFPWARCVRFADRTGVPMLAPHWFQPRIGPLLRGGIAFQAYHRQILLAGLFRSAGYVGGITRFRVERSWPRRVNTNGVDDQVEPDVLYSFEGDANHFADLVGQRTFLLERLRRDTRPRWTALAERMAAPIVINVRAGRDFRPAVSSSDYFTKGGVRTPNDWFVACLKSIRRLAGATVPAVVVSDGAETDLREILAEPAVRFARPGCAASDLLTLASARVLVGSGGSSFSAWGAFLSGAPVVTHPGQSLQWFKLGAAGDQFVGEFDPSTAANPDWEDAVRRALG